MRTRMNRTQRMDNSRGMLFLIMLLLISMLAGCAGNKEAEQTASGKQSVASGTETVTFTDDLGRTVEVDTPQRVAAMIGSFADIWLLAGGEIKAAGQDAWTAFELNLPEDAVDIGSIHEPNVELLIAAEPDFVLASSNLDGNLELEEILEEAGIPVAYFDVSGFDDYLRMLNICTQITGHRENYEKYGTAVQTQIEATLERVDGSSPEILYLRAISGQVKAKGSEGNVGSEILKALGCVNIADSDTSLLEDLSMEAIIAANPDYIFVTSLSEDADKVLEELVSNPAWQSLTAVQAGHFYQLDKALYNSKPNARWGEAYEQLADILYGDGK